jgi:hypothetical protein
LGQQSEIHVPQSEVAGDTPASTLPDDHPSPGARRNRR